MEANSSSGENSAAAGLSNPRCSSSPVQARSDTGNRTLWQPDLLLLQIPPGREPDTWGWPMRGQSADLADQWEGSVGGESWGCKLLVYSRLETVQTRTTTNNLLLIGKLWLTRFHHPFSVGNQSCINLNSQQIQLSLSQTWLDESIIIRLLYSLSSMTSGRIGWQLITW